MSLPRPLCLPLLVACVIFVAVPAAHAAPREPMPNPEFTRGDSIPDDAPHDWNLGATGMRGWMYTSHFTTTEARQVYVTEVAKGSPADGVMKVGDVILGVFGEKFSHDPRTEIGQALSVAETEQAGGKLILTRWRGGQTEEVTLQLRVMGSYSDTAPYDCAKSEKIFKQGCVALARRMSEPGYKPNAIVRSLNALALLASEDERYARLLRREVRAISEFSAGSFQTWWYGYCITFLAEYVILTNDDSVMPGLKRLVSEAVRGQSIVGSWGHRFAGDDGRLVGYGMMNAPGLPLTTGLVLAREAGLDSPELDLAIKRSTDLLRFYVGKGCIPYGDHAPWTQTHDDNGKNGMAAVLFNLLKEPEPTEYFSRMSVASHGPERDWGHTGNFWNMTWALPGVLQSGKHASGAWMKEFGGWYFDLARQWDGGFAHLGPPQPNNDSTSNWDATGAYLLALAAPRDALRLTSAKHRVAPQVSAEQAAQLIAAGRDWTTRDRRTYGDHVSNKELVQRLRSWSPVVRERAAITLARRGLNITRGLVEMLGSDDLHARYGACQALKHQGRRAAQAVPALRQTFRADDLWLRILAAQALAGIGDPARVAANDLLKRVTQHDVESDPRNMEQRYVVTALFNRRGGLIGRSLQGVDGELLFEAVRAGLQNQDGRARGTISSLYDNLSFKELQPLMPAIHRAIVEPSPSGIMFADGIRMAGLRLFAKHRVDKGVELLAMYARDMKQHGSQKRMVPVMEMLLSYGKHAQAVLPHLEETLEYVRNEPNFPQWARDEKAKALAAGIAKIKAATDEPKLYELKLPPEEQHASR